MAEGPQESHQANKILMGRKTWTSHFNRKSIWAQNLALILLRKD